MKKFAKTLALVLALCMVMSVSVFASGAELADNYVIDITVDTATGDEQVALLVVEAGAGITDESILFVGQKAATGGEAVFSDVEIDSSVDAVDIYAGNATYAAGGSYETVYSNLSLTKEITSVTVVMDPELTIVNGATEKEDGSTTLRLYGSAVSAKFTFTLPTVNPVTEAYMIWSLRTKADGTVDENTRYTPAIDISEHLDGLEGPIRLSVAFGNGAHDGTEAKLDIKGASAIFKFVRSGAADQEVVLDNADVPNDSRLEQN